VLREARHAAATKRSKPRPANGEGAHLVEQLVDEHKVVSNGFLSEVTKVVLENLDHLVQELECKGCLRIAL
jgi:hypothetical protein